MSNETDELAQYIENRKRHPGNGLNRVTYFSYGLVKEIPLQDPQYICNSIQLFLSLSLNHHFLIFSHINICISYKWYE